MINLGLFLLNLILQMALDYALFHWDVGGEALFLLAVAQSAFFSLGYTPLLKMLKQREFGYFYGLGSLLFIVGLSQVLGYLVYFIAENAWEHHDFEAVIVCSGEFAICLFVLGAAYSVSYSFCRALWKN